MKTKKGKTGLRLGVMLPSLCIVLSLVSVAEFAEAGTTDEVESNHDTQIEAAVEGTSSDAGNETDTAKEKIDEAEISAEDTVIKSVELNVRLSYNAGDAPQRSVSVSAGCDVLYEGWTELDENGYGVAYWWSDGNYGSSETKFTQFEEGKTYIYEIGLTEAEGGTSLSPDDGLMVTLNGVTVPSENVRAYSDADCEYILQIIGPKMTVSKPIGQGYVITEGANGTWTQNSGGTLTFKANGDMNKFTEIKVDGNIVPKGMYTAESGSTIITLKNEYLATLSVGKHTLAVVNEDGEATTEFEIKAAAVDPPHTHSYGGWQSDAMNHWKECSCGDKTEIGAHSFQWIVDKAATAAQKGSKHEECKVCGYKRSSIKYRPLETVDWMKCRRPETTAI